MSKIVALDIASVKRITAAHIKPDGSMVIIGGDNAAGKSSVLDAIAYALGGKSLLPAEPLRRGEESGHAEVTLDDGVTIRRTFTAAGGSLKITTADGLRPTAAQTWLDARIGALSFDPSAFLRSRPQDQAETLRQLCGVDTTALDVERSRLYDERTEVGRDGKRAAGAASSAPHYDDAPEDEVVLADLIQERREYEQAQRAQLAVVAAAQRSRESAGTRETATLAASARAEQDATNLEVRAEELTAQAAELSTQATQVRERGDQASQAGRGAVRQHEADAERLEKEAALQLEALPDIEAIDERISTAEETNRQVRAHTEHTRLAAEYARLRADYSALTGQLEVIDVRRAAMLESAAMPLDGLSISPAGVVTYQEIPLDQASQAEQLRVSLGVGMAMSPDLPIFLIRDGSLLDAAGLQLVADEAERVDAQVWIERVGDADEGVIVIEDGTVRG